VLVDRLAHLVLTKTDTVSAGQDRLAHLVLTKTDTVSAGQDRLAHLVDKDRHSEGWSRQVSIEVLQVVLPLALPGQVHQGGPFAPPQLYQFPLLIYACIEARHLQNHDAHGIELVADGIKLVAHGIQLVADGIKLVADCRDASELATCSTLALSVSLAHQCLRRSPAPARP